MPGTKADFDAIFATLRQLFEPVSGDLVTVHDTAGNYYLDVDHIMPNRKPLYFGGVRKGKSYVSLYLMPVYVHPELLESVSPELRARMQGKSCFNLRELDSRQLDELRELVRVGFDAFRKDGYL